MSVGIRLSPESDLVLAGTYERQVAASLPRVWENVFDWQHLPALHAGYFAAVELLQNGPLGWRIGVVNQPGGPDRAQVLELQAERAAGRYCVATLQGPGVGTRIKTRLTVLGRRRTGIEVEFHVPKAPRDRLAATSARYQASYERLWDEDEVMMIARQRACDAKARRRSATAPRTRHLGAIDALRRRLPLVITFGGERFRIVDLDGVLVVHGVTCPHWLGPLEATRIVAGCIRCPWHGYSFDVRTGRSAEGRGLRLAEPPRIFVEGGQVSLTTG